VLFVETANLSLHRDRARKNARAQLFRYLRVQRSCATGAAPAHCTRRLADMKAPLSILVFLVLASAQGASLAAEAIPSETVSTFGHWEHAGKTGVFRIVMSESGLEQVKTTVLAEWVEDPTASSPSPQVRSSVYIFRNYMATFVPPKVKVYKNRVRVTLEGIFMRASDGSVSCVIDLLADGKVNVVRECTRWQMTPHAATGSR
jgi:hypothetical protein